MKKESTTAHFSRRKQNITWSFHDPYSFTGPREKVLHQTREIRGQTEDKIRGFVRDAQHVTFWAG